MVALVYHPAYDPYGSVLRSLQFVSALRQSVFREQIRIFDFLILFPEFISTFRLSPQLRSRLRKVDIKPRFAYEERPSALRLFEEMAPTFEAAFQTLMSKGILEVTDTGTQAVGLNAGAVPGRLSALVADRNASAEHLLRYLIELNASFPFFGPDGLKARSGLLEFRYDIA